MIRFPTDLLGIAAVTPIRCITIERGAVMVLETTPQQDA